MRKITILLLALILGGMLIPTGFAIDSNVVITYGETTYSNSNYKSFVDNFFINQANVDINNVGIKTISADQVNQISSGITGKSYTSGQILSSALVDLNDNQNLKVSVDKSKITTITGDMYLSALKSVRRPVQATGESALGRIINSYEEVTDVQIPDSVKEAANDEIYTQAEIVNNSGVNADDLSNLVNQVKDEVAGDNITNHNEIVNIITNKVENNNINITNVDIENLANSIEQVQNVQGDVNYYKDQVSDVFGNSTADGMLEGFFNLDSSINGAYS